MQTKVTETLAAHIVDAEDRGLAPLLAERAKQHLLDGLVAVLSGATLRPGRLAVRYAEAQAARGESTVAGGPRTTMEIAAFANAISAHADETDDVNNRARIHPGASIVPAALAVGESLDRPGTALLVAVSLGYDVAYALNVAAWSTFRAMQGSVRTSHGLGQTFGAAAAAASLARLPADSTQHVLSYAAQQVAGISTFYRDPDHIGKAFSTAAMQAHSGVRSVELVRHGFTAIDDVLDGSPNLFDAFGEAGDGERILQELSEPRGLLTTDIKKYPVGGPIQAAAEAVEHLIHEQGLKAEFVDEIRVHLPTQGAYIVNDRDMPDICLQYILSVLLLDGAITFANSHDYERMGTAPVQALMGRIVAVPDRELDPTGDADPNGRRTWRAVVRVTTRGGDVLEKRIDPTRGDQANPLNWDELERKAQMALAEVLPARQVDALVAWVKAAETAGSVRELRTFLAVSSGKTVADDLV
ncbi:MmgE/PrpD family protein [Amycolatopsis rubida]|uniref:MmgE/PrpD family protein n=1 Tax=Amycolatopsis rubida TaxID=112413 RepID=A0ABX0BZT7_9PSEU|nr:MmgE/PrpD family protein [Amycolatopsis sp. M39]MYW96111.1 hypothetical protein [Amycolatopsis rubida]NEC61102.1 MmgE/PrpD family protein [Amycolatopsis rubida]OAP23376.1 MmgE/PrpD family protein [Amycolatopsis sp. M39]